MHAHGVWTGTIDVSPIVGLVAYLYYLRLIRDVFDMPCPGNVQKMAHVVLSPLQPAK